MRRRALCLPTFRIHRRVDQMRVAHDTGQTSIKGNAMNAAEKCKGVGFGDALRLLNEGRKVRRAGWNGKGMWLALVGAGECVVSRSVTEFSTCGLVYEMAEWIGMKTADEKLVPWLASQTDVLANDWEVVG